MLEKELKKLYRYSDSENAYIIDVQLEDYRDAYSNWDYSPFLNRDLDEDLLEYLVSCSEEIPKKKKFLIDFHILHQKKDPVRESKMIQGIENHQNYRMRLLRTDKYQMYRNSMFFFLLGIVFLVVALTSGEYLADGLLKQLVSEGFFIGAWVMIWEMFSIFFFELNKITEEMRHFKRIRDSKIIFHYEEG